MITIYFPDHLTPEHVLPVEGEGQQEAVADEEQQLGEDLRPSEQEREQGEVTHRGQDQEISAMIW